MPAPELIKQLRSNPNDRDLLRATASLLFAQPHAFVGSLVAEGMAAERKVESTLARLLKRFCLKKRIEWKNFCATQVAHPRKISYPQTQDDLKNILREAARLDCQVRAVGSAHAWSDVALTDGIVIETHGLARPLPVFPEVLRNPASVDDLFQVEAGVTIRDLNRILDIQGRALINMGGYDGQTLAGVISTSTHGSGLSLGSFPSMVEALIVLTADGQLLQIEKADGISEPEAFARKYGSERKLIQDDKFFNACVVGMGCLGIVYAVIIRVHPKYWLQETRRVLTWGDVKEQLRQGAILETNRHVEVLLNPHKVGADHMCLLTTRNIVPEPTSPTPPKPFRDVFAEMLASLPDADRVLTFLFNEFPTLAPHLIEEALKALEDDGYIDLSYRIFNVGAVNAYMGISSEWAVDLNVHLEAAQALLDMADQYQTQGVYHSSPIAIRYVAASPGFLSMQPGPTCMFEMPLLRDVHGGDAILQRYEDLLTSKFKARPHWGQLNFLTANHDLIKQMYPQLDEWLKVFTWFNQPPRFYSPFTNRLGFSTESV